ncbi:MAG: type II toxin-antitoxin system VapC family toxin [Propionibacteriaceae bacterium]|jgi:predicted nucleic acid-binding protein|nr:type II toxin-antitoxin system VapC family toxin [Propionibacteriaceae bacterium]
MRFLLDTNVVSELRATKAHPEVVAWIKSLTADQIFLSVLTIGEIRRGVASLANRDPARAKALDSWLTGLQVTYSEHILPLTLAIADHWGIFNATRTFPAVDSLIAATAYEHGLTVATRNVSDFDGLDVSVFNPFSGQFVQ